MLHLFLFILGLWSCCVHFQVNCRVDPNDFASIYASTYELKWDSQDPLEMFSVIRVSAKNDVFVAAQNNGIIVIREKDIIYSKPESESVQNLFITSDGEYVFLNLNNRLCVRNFIEVSPNVFDFKLIFEELDHSENGSVVDVTFDKSESRAIATLQNGVLNLYDVSERTSNRITYLDSFNTNFVLMMSKISVDLKWIVIADYQLGFIYFRWMDDDLPSTQSPLVKNQLNMYMIGTTIAIMETNFYITKDSRYVITLDYYEGISTYDLKPLQDIHGSNVKPSSFEIIDMVPVLKGWWPAAKGESSSSALAVSADEKFAAMGERSVAIYIVDIRDVLNPKLYQKIKATSMSYSVSFSMDSNEEYLFYSNGVSLLRFIKQQPNLNIDIPNLYNVHRSMNNAAGQRWYYFGLADKNQQFYFLTAQDMGLYILDMRKSVVLMDDCVHFEAGVQSYTDNFTLFGGNSQRYLALPRQNYTTNTMMDIYDITDRTQPTLVLQIGVENISYSGSIDVFEARNLLIFDNLHSIVLVNTSSLPNSIEIKSIFNFENGQFKQLNCILISNKGDYALLLARTKGLYLINIEDLSNPVRMNFEAFLGCELLVQGKYTHSSYMFLADGLQGIKVIDQNAFPLIKIIKVIEVRGFALGLTLLKQDKFALVSSVDVGQISLIDLTDITSATVISTFQFQNEDARTVSILHNEDFFYLVNYKGVRAAPLYSDTYIHMDIEEVLNSQTGTPTLKTIGKETIFQVGQIINLTFIILRPVDGISITGIYYLQYYDEVEIPYWMTYNSKEQILQLKIVKDSLGSDYSSNDAKVQKNTIVIETKRSVLISDFVFSLVSDGVECSIVQAELIWEYFRTIGVLDKQAHVTSLFEYENELTFDIGNVPSSEKLFQLVKMALQESIMQNPIMFSVKASLAMHVTPSSTTGDNNSEQKNYFEFIETISEYVYLYLTINRLIGKFVSKTYAGVITSTNDTFDQIKLEGDPININKVLTSKVQLFLYNSTKSLISEYLISVRLTDNTNYEVQQSHSLDSVGFLNLLPQVSQNPEMRLQDQVERKFSSRFLDIKTNIDLQFASNSFLADADSQLTYSAKVVVKQNVGENEEMEEYSEIEKNFWFQFQASQFKFSGTSTFSDYNKETCFLVNATDSYSWVTDEFCVNAKGIPLIVILNHIIQYIGPILFIIGLYKYKDRIYNLTYSKENFYIKQELKVGEQFEMQTIFAVSQMIIAREIYDLFLTSYKMKQQKLPLIIRIVDWIKIQREQFKSCIQRCLSKRKAINVVEDRIQYLKKQNNLPSQIQKRISEKYLDKTDNNNNNNNNNSSILIEKFFNDIMNLNITKIANSSKVDFDRIQSDLEQDSSILRVCLLNELARNLLEQDQLSKYIYSLTKLNDYTVSNSKLDRYYYRKYTTVNHSISLENNQTHLEKFKEQFQQQNSQMIPLSSKLPRVKINEMIIKKYFKSFDRFFNDSNLEQRQTQNEVKNISFNSGELKSSNEVDKNNSKIDQVNNSLINKQLIKQVIIFDALGLDPQTVSSYSPCVGESLHLKCHEITSVQAFQKPRKIKKYSKLRFLLNLDYLPIASHENRKIPQWLNLSFKKNILVLEGKPGADEEGNEYLIRYYDNRQFIVKQFIIRILSDDAKQSVASMEKQEENRLLISTIEQEFIIQSKKIVKSGGALNILPQHQTNTNQSIYEMTPDESPSIHSICFPPTSTPPIFNPSTS